jgi:hypothetical protein
MGGMMMRLADFQDEEAKAFAQAECDKRNLHKGKHHNQMMWKATWTRERGWHPAFRPCVEATKKESGRGVPKDSQD